MQTTEDEWAKMVDKWSITAKEEMKEKIEELKNQVFKKRTVSTAFYKAVILPGYLLFFFFQIVQTTQLLESSV